MPSQSTSKCFLVVLVLSLFVLTVLLLGCFGEFGVQVVRASPRSNAVELKCTDVSLDAGRFRVVTQTSIAVGGPAPTTWLRWNHWRPRLPDLKRMIWEFDAHPLPLPSAQIFLFAFPIWMLALPFLVAPTIYLRRRLKNRPDPEGFAVVGVAP